MKIRLLIAAIADELEERAFAIARSEGALGVTVADARGLGFPEHMTFFGLTYVGREKLLMVLAEAERVEHIAERMNVELGLLAPFQGLGRLPVRAGGSRGPVWLCRQDARGRSGWPPEQRAQRRRRGHTGPPIGLPQNGPHFGVTAPCKTPGIAASPCVELQATLRQRDRHGGREDALTFCMEVDHHSGLDLSDIGDPQPDE